MSLSNSKTTKAKRKQVSANAAWHSKIRGELAEIRADYKAFLAKHPEFKPAKKASKTVKTTGKVVCENDKFKSFTATIYSNPANSDKQKIVLTSYKKTGRGGINAAIKRNVKSVEVKKTKVAKDKKEEERLEKVVAKSQADARKKKKWNIEEELERQWRRADRRDKITERRKNKWINEMHDGYYDKFYILNKKKVEYKSLQRILIESLRSWAKNVTLTHRPPHAVKEINRLEREIKRTGLVPVILDSWRAQQHKETHSNSSDLVWVYPNDKELHYKNRRKSL